MNNYFDRDADLETQLLQLLNTHTAGLSVSELQACLISHIQPFRDRAQLKEILEHLEGRLLVHRDTAVYTHLGLWVITDSGKHHLRVRAAQEPERQGELVEASRQPDEPAHDDSANAMLCVSESELDEWWGEFDVEIKAALFSMWTLGSDRPLSRGIEVGDPIVRARLQGQPSINGKDYEPLHYPEAVQQ